MATGPESRALDGHLILNLAVRGVPLDLGTRPPFAKTCCFSSNIRGTSGQKSQAQIEAFEDTWKWTDEAEDAFDAVMSSGNTDVAELLRSMRAFLKENDMMAYLCMMAIRVLELHCVLKSTGSLYIHCDPTASHYLKLLMDSVFRPQNFRNEIIWQRTSAHANVTQKFGAVHDVLFFYSKTDEFTWNQQHTPYTAEYIKTFFDQVDNAGKRYFRRDLTASMSRASSGQLYEWMGIRPSSSRCWAMAKERMDALVSRLSWKWRRAFRR